MSRLIRDAQPVLDALCQRLWPSAALQHTARLRRPVAASDAALLARARAARNGELFALLWSGDWQTRYGSQSEADLALCGFLAFWCNGDAERVDGLFRQSGLYREKWERNDYRQWTLTRACTGGRA
jgi:primase-polymerase (primpol)-like protein